MELPGRLQKSAYSQIHLEPYPNGITADNVDGRDGNGDLSQTNGDIGIKKRNPRSNLGFVRDGWFWEVTSVVFSAACIVAIAVILRVIDGKLLSSWKSAVTPNAIVSVLATAAKASLVLPLGEAIGQFKWLHLKTDSHNLEDLQIYDTASRGPWGAAVFIWHFRRGPAITYLAAVGSFVMIVALAIDPFSQQILSYVNRPTVIPDRSATIRRTLTYNYGDQGLGYSGDIISARDPGMASAVVEAILGSTSDPKLHCPSSNCTYPDFLTLGVSSTCKDVTNDTTRKCHKTSLGQHCKWTLPGPMTLSGDTASDAHSGNQYSQLNATMQYNSVGPIKTPQQFATVGIIRLPIQYGFDSWPSRMEAWECGLSTVAYAYLGTNIINGTIHTPDIRMSTLHSSGDGPVIPYKATDESNNFPANVTYKINYYDSENLGQIFYTIFGPGSTTNFYDTGMFATVFRTANISQMFDGIARAMTNHMMVAPNSEEVVGAASAPQTYIEVGWIWLVLPIVLVAITCCFLATAIVVTRMERQGVWKSSLYPLLAIPVRGDFPTEEYAAEGKLSHMEALARRSTSGLHSRAQIEKRPSEGNGSEIGQRLVP